ncbi:hypothetical protein [Pimelobacter simplex]|uniref:hypothetical protein n=1 Tax=Nocardioides simplex TaxID=2045 RepID=UPI00215055C4|nr:hypothetical protein [Pimelobacter simplex]UUW92400.1 hypothetical protein M0M43_13225 [Pimelobacter simplex]UUW96228.1 hypothetical protein M0M48_01860 [Pimelobacter simplex]
MKRRMQGLLLVGAAMMLTACGGADPAEVTAAASELTASDGPLGVPVEKKQAECRVRVLLESDLSDAAKDAIKRGEAPAPHAEGDAEALREAADQIATECAS